MILEQIKSLLKGHHIIFIFGMIFFPNITSSITKLDPFSVKLVEVVVTKPVVDTIDRTVVTLCVLLNWCKILLNLKMSLF